MSRVSKLQKRYGTHRRNAWWLRALAARLSGTIREGKVEVQDRVVNYSFRDEATGAVYVGLYTAPPPERPGRMVKVAVREGR